MAHTHCVITETQSDKKHNKLIQYFASENAAERYLNAVRRRGLVAYHDDDYVVCNTAVEGLRTLNMFTR